MKPKLASIVLCVLTLVASVYGMTLNDELLSAFMAMNHHAHIVEVAPSTANSNGMPSVVGERTLPVASLIEVGSTTREQASESDVHDSIKRDEDGCAVEILHQFRQHFNMSKAELLDYVNNYVPAHTDKSVFSGEILLEQENDAPIRWLAGAQTLGLGFDVSKTMDVSSATGQIFDLPLEGEYTESNVCGAKVNIPSWALVTRQCEAVAKTIFADNEQGLTFAVAAGGDLPFRLGIFKGTLSLDLKLHLDFNTRTIYGKHFNDLNLARVELADAARAPFSPAFKRDIDALPESWETDPIAFHKFVTKWGTHYIRRYMLGARLEVTTVTRNNLVGFGFGLEAAAKLGVDLIVMSLSGSAGIGIGVGATFAAKTTTGDYRMTGGDPSLVAMAQVVNLLLPEQRTGYPSSGALLAQWFESAVTNPASFNFGYAPIANLAETDSKRRALHFATTLYLDNQRPEEVLVVRAGNPRWNAFQTFPSGDCINFLVSTAGSDEVRLALAAAPGWVEKSYIFRATPYEMTIMTGTNEILATSKNSHLRTLGEPGMFADFLVCFHEATFHIGSRNRIYAKVDVSSKGWDVFYYAFSGASNSDSFYIAGLNRVLFKDVQQMA